MNTVLVYRGEGAGWRSVKSTCENVERLLLTGPLRRFVKRVKVNQAHVTSLQCSSSTAGHSSKRISNSSTGPLCVDTFQVDTLSTKDLLDGSWTQQAALLVMPGGADLPYCKHLNGRGNRIIKGWHKPPWTSINAANMLGALCAAPLQRTCYRIFLLCPVNRVCAEWRSLFGPVCWRLLWVCTSRL